MTTDTKAVARYRAILSHGLIEVEAYPVGSLVTFTDHERVVGELCSTMFAMNEKHFSDFNKLGELLKHRDRELAASRAEVERQSKVIESYRNSQPGEQEPVCFITEQDANLIQRHDITFRHVATYWDRPGKEAIPVYFGQPAQGIGLGQFRELAESWKVVLDPDPTPIMQAHQHANHCCADELLALLNGRHAGTGVE